MVDGFFKATSMPDREWWAALWPDPLGVIASLGARPEMTALDLCCGDGYFTIPLAKLVMGQVYALDLDPEMIRQARVEADRQGITVIAWITGDACEVATLLPRHVDLVLLANTFHGVPDQLTLAKAIAQVLNPDGLLAIVNWHPCPREQTTVLGQPRGPRTDMRMSADTLRAVLEPAGFQLTHLVDLPPYHYGAVFKYTS